MKYLPVNLTLCRPTQLDIDICAFWSSSATDFLWTAQGKSWEAIILRHRNWLLRIQRWRWREIALRWKRRKHVVLVQIAAKTGEPRKIKIHNFRMVNAKRYWKHINILGRYLLVLYGFSSSLKFSSNLWTDLWTGEMDHGFDAGKSSEKYLLLINWNKTRILRKVPTISDA